MFSWLIKMGCEQNTKANKLDVSTYDLLLFNL